jgi:chemotaxis protein CheC
MTKEINQKVTYDGHTQEPNLLNSQEADSGILLELGSIGAGHAATSLSEILQQPILIEVPKMLDIEPHLIPKFFNKHEMPTIAVYLSLRETYSCDILLMFELAEARKIAAMMSCLSSVEELDPFMEKSAIHELANILIGSFLTSISDFIGVQLMPTTPESMVDSFDAILDGFLIKQSISSENAMLFETRFKREGDDAKCMLMIFPSQELRQLMTEKSKILLGI